MGVVFVDAALPCWSPTTARLGVVVAGANSLTNRPGRRAPMAGDGGGSHWKLSSARISSPSPSEL